MPPGPPPKDSKKRERRNAETFPTVELGTSKADTSLAPKVPKSEWRKLHRKSRAWWNTWLEAPQASEFVGTDWRRLYMVGLPLVDAFNRAIDAGEVKLAKELSGELRMLEREFGATPESRIRNRWVVRKPGQTPQRDDDEQAKRAPAKAAADPRRGLKVVAN